MQTPHSEPAADELPATIIYGALALDSTGFTVTVDGRDLPVTLAEFLLLKEFIMNPYRVLDRATLARALGRRGFGYSTSHLSARTVDLHISHLRKKLHQAGYDCIKTMRFVGYRFVPVVAVECSP